MKHERVGSNGGQQKQQQPGQDAKAELPQTTKDVATNPQPAPFERSMGQGAVSPTASAQKVESAHAYSEESNNISAKELERMMRITTNDKPPLS